MTLIDRLRTIDRIQARRFERTSGSARAIAEKGIIRHLNACDHYGVNPDIAAVREVIDDALNGRAIYEEMSQPLHKGANMPKPLLLTQPWVQELLTRESFTSEEAGKLCGVYKADAIHRLRQCKDLRLTVVGLAEDGKQRMYRIRRADGQ